MRGTKYRTNFSGAGGYIRADEPLQNLAKSWQDNALTARLEENKQNNLNRQREDTLARQEVIDGRYATEQKWKNKQRSEQQRAWNQAETDRVKKLDIEKAIQGVDINFTPSADRRITGVEDYVTGLLGKDPAREIGENFTKVVGSIDGTDAERIQHKLFTENINKAYDSVGEQDKIDAKKEVYNAYRTAGASRSEAEAGAKMKTAGMLSKAEKQVAVQAQYDRDFEDKVKLYELNADAANKEADRASKESVARIKGKKGSSGGYGGSPSAFSENAAREEINTFLSQGDKPVKNDEMKDFQKMAGELVDTGDYTWRDINSAIKGSVDRDPWFWDPEVDPDVLKATLANTVKDLKKPYYSGGASTGNDSLSKLAKYRAELGRGYASAEPQQTSAEVLSAFKSRMAGKDLKVKAPTAQVKRSSKPLENSKTVSNKEIPRSPDQVAKDNRVELDFKNPLLSTPYSKVEDKSDTNEIGKNPSMSVAEYLMGGDFGSNTAVPAPIQSRLEKRVEQASKNESIGYIGPETIKLAKGIAKEVNINKRNSLAREAYYSGDINKNLMSKIISGITEKDFNLLEEQYNYKNNINQYSPPSEESQLDNKVQAKMGSLEDVRKSLTPPNEVQIEKAIVLSSIKSHSEKRTKAKESFLKGDIDKNLLTKILNDISITAPVGYNSSGGIPEATPDLMNMYLGGVDENRKPHFNEAESKYLRDILNTKYKFE